MRAGGDWVGGILSSGLQQGGLDVKKKVGHCQPGEF